jgi:hypothetical protein
VELVVTQTQASDTITRGRRHRSVERARRADAHFVQHHNHHVPWRADTRSAVATGSTQSRAARSPHRRIRAPQADRRVLLLPVHSQSHIGQRSRATSPKGSPARRGRHDRSDRQTASGKRPAPAGSRGSLLLSLRSCSMSSKARASPNSESTTCDRCSMTPRRSRCIGRRRASNSSPERSGSRFADSRTATMAAT